MTQRRINAAILVPLLFAPLASTTQTGCEAAALTARSTNRNASFGAATEMPVWDQVPFTGIGERVPPVAALAECRGRAPISIESRGDETSNFAIEPEEPRAGAKIPATRTPLSGSEAAVQLRKAWTRVRGNAPKRQLIEVLAAQWAHETAGGASMFNFNFGGLRGKSSTRLTFAFLTHEGRGDKSRIELGEFRAYPNAEGGASDYLFLLVRQYPDAIGPAERGDVPEFVQALKRGGYFTGSEEAYTRSLVGLQKRIQKWGFDALSKWS